jgi:hypothetical protein
LIKSMKFDLFQPVILDSESRASCQVYIYNRRRVVLKRVKREYQVTFACGILPLNDGEWFSEERLQADSSRVSEAMINELTRPSNSTPVPRDAELAITPLDSEEYLAYGYKV